MSENGSDRDYETRPEDLAANTSEPVDATLTDDALDLVKAAVRGNGLKPEDVSFAGFAGEILAFEAFEIFRIEPEVSEKLNTGKRPGQVVGSRQEARNKVQATIEKITFDPEVRQQTIDVLKKRADLGFGQENIGMLFDRLRTSYTVHELCSVCSGNADTMCNLCHGKGQTPCRQCKGTRRINCPACRGMQYVQGDKGSRALCMRCNGQGKIGCPTCQQRGFESCSGCKGTGRAGCSGCAGTGWHSHVTALQVRARSRFDYGRDSLPAGVVERIDGLRGALVTGGHAAVRLNDSRERAGELNRASKADEYVIPYDVRLPWGDIGFYLGGAPEPVCGQLFGLTPALLHMPPFLEKLVAPGLAALGASFKDAARFRLSGEVLLAAARYAPKKALDAMRGRYPFGISASALQTAVRDAARGLRRVTKTARLVGLAAGLALAAGLDALYWFGPLRALAAARAGALPVLNAFDFLLAAAGAALIYACVQAAARKALRDALGVLLRKGGKNLAHGRGQSILWALGGGIAVYAAVLQAALMRGLTMPAWLAVLLHAAP